MAEGNLPRRRAGLPGWGRFGDAARQSSSFSASECSPGLPCLFHWDDCSLCDCPLRKVMVLSGVCTQVHGFHRSQLSWIRHSQSFNAWGLRATLRAAGQQVQRW